MSWLKDNKLYVFLIYVNLMFIMLLVKSSYVIRNFSYLYVSLLYFSAFLIYWGYISIFRRKIIKVILWILIVGGIVAYCLKNINYVSQFFLQNIVNKAAYINSLVAQGIPTSFQDYKYIFIIIIPLVTIILIFLVSKGFANSILIFTLAITTTLWYFGYTEIIKKYLFYYMFISLITYCINAFLRNIRRLSKRGIKVNIDIWKILIYTVLVSTVIASITNVLPQEYNGRYGTDIRSRIYNKYAKQPENPEETGKKLVYDLSYSGYDSNKKKLGGPVFINRLIAFRVKSDKQYYLRGTVKDLYDGFSWNRTQGKYTLKSPEMSYSFFNDTFSRILVDSSHILTIYPEELNTSTIFAPALVYMASTSDNRDIYFDEIPTLMSNGNLTKPYDVFFYDLNAEGRKLFSKEDQLKIKEIGASYYMENYKKYLQVPDNISSRTYDLVYSIVKDKRNNFEKVNAIRDYLRKNYKYSLQVSNVPENQEFLDYFLFVEKKGYCTYFATAETIMCRIAGIPARYVEGFNMSSEKDENGNFIVRNENAHAWAEVLFISSKGTGLWYTVDAVPDAVDIIHRDEQQEKENITSNNTPNTQSGTNGRKNIDVDNEANTTEALTRAIIPKSIFRLIYTLLGLFSINIVLMLVHWLKKKSVLNSTSIIPIFKYSLQRIEDMGIRRGAASTDFEFIEKLNEDIKPIIKQAADLAYREYYGDKPPQDFDKAKYYNSIERYIRKEQNWLKYFAKKYYFIGEISLIFKNIMLLYKKKLD